MTVDDIIKWHEHGLLTTNEAVFQLVSGLTPSTVNEVMSKLNKLESPTLRSELRQFAREYRPDSIMISSGSGIEVTLTEENVAALSLVRTFAS